MLRLLTRPALFLGAAGMTAALLAAPAGPAGAVAGIDTPERGKPLYGAAKRSLDRVVGARVTLVNPSAVQDKDAYGRLLRYVRVSRRDTGRVQIRKGLAHARYDSRDGYDWHPMQKVYRRLDGRARDRW